MLWERKKKTDESIVSAEEAVNNGLIFRENKESEKAIECFQKAIDIMREIG